MLLLLIQGGLNIPTMAARGGAGMSGGHRMAASHSPHLEEGLLAQSLESHLPNFGEPPPSPQHP